MCVRAYDSRAVDQLAESSTRSHQAQPNLRVIELADSRQELFGVIRPLGRMVLTEFIGTDWGPEELESTSPNDPLRAVGII